MIRDRVHEKLAAHVGQRLREKRTALGLSQYDIAARLGTGQNRVCHHEGGIHLPSLPMLVDYSDVYGCTVAELLEGIC